jgi:hypothetical protein
MSETTTREVTIGGKRNIGSLDIPQIEEKRAAAIAHRRSAAQQAAHDRDQAAIAAAIRRSQGLPPDEPAAAGEGD